MTKNIDNRAAEKLQDAIGMIDESHVIEASDYIEYSTAPGNVVEFEPSAKRPGKKGAWKPVAAILAAAACCAIVSVGVMGNFDAAREAADDVPVANVSSDKSAMTESFEADGYASVAGDAAMGESESRSRSAESSDSATNSYTDAIDMSCVEDPAQADAFILTAGVWDDNLNWPFFTNLINSGKITFPSFGIDPTHRVHVKVRDASGNPIRGQAVVLKSGGEQVFASVSDKEGNAYLFYPAGSSNLSVEANGRVFEVGTADDGRQQGGGTASDDGSIDVTVDAASKAPAGTQVAFILDTTGSMSDELAYLQKDFASIAAEVGNDGVEYSVTFYRDKGDDYVVKSNPFTSDVSKIQSVLMAESARGGGDTPEAVDQALSAAITDNSAWRDDCAKVAFLIFDAPPHEGTEGSIRAAVASAASRGIKLVPVVASNAERETELFGRALAIVTGTQYVFLTDDSGVGNPHLEPIVSDYTVEKLHDVIVRIVNAER